MVADAIGKACVAAAIEKVLPDGNPCRRLSAPEVQRIADTFGAPGRRVEEAALGLGILPERYERNFQTFDARDQTRLLRARAAVIGLGGLGGSVLDILARAGVGCLRLVDGDRFEGHNLNRQLLATTANLGAPKFEAAAARVALVNPSITVEAKGVFMGPENAGGIVGGMDVVVDCLDTIQARFHLQDACRQLGVPLVSAAIAGASGHVTVIWPGDDGLVAIYGPEGAERQKGAETVLGTLPFTVSVAAGLEGAEALKVLLGREPLLRGRLLMFDVLAGTFDTVSLSPGIPD